MSDDDQTMPLSGDNDPSEPGPTRSAPPEPAASVGPSEPAPVSPRPPIFQRTWVRVTGAVVGGILLVGAGMGIGWGLAGDGREWDLAAQSEPGTHHPDGHADMRAPDDRRSGPGGPVHDGPGAERHGPRGDASLGQDDHGDAGGGLPSASMTPAG